MKKRKIISMLLIICFLGIIILIGGSKNVYLYNKQITVVTSDYNYINIFNYKNKIFYFSNFGTIVNHNLIKNNVLDNNIKIKLYGNYYRLKKEESFFMTKWEENNYLNENNWFNKEIDEKSRKDYKENKHKITKIYWHNQEKDPSKIGYIFTIPKTLFSTKPYFKLQLFAEVNNSELLKEAGYGMVIKGYDIYLPNNKVLKNDYERTETNEQKEIYIEGVKQDINNPLFKEIKENKVIQKGTNHKTEAEYQIFYNNDKAIIIWGEFDYVENLFKWEVFRPFFTKKESENTFKPLYIAILNEVTLNHKDSTWVITSKEFNGNVKTLIKDWTF